MKKIYNKVLNKFIKIPIWIDKTKNKLYYKMLLRKNKDKYKKIKWTKDQKREFSNFWIQNYGLKINNKYHRFIESITGTYNHMYMPDNLFHSKIEYSANDFYVRRVLGDKNIMNNFYKNIENINVPKSVVSNTSGQFRDGDNKVILIDRAINIIKQYEKIIIKPATDTSGGRNVKLIETSSEDIKSCIQSYKRDYIVQEFIDQHESTAVFHPNSGNTIRFITYIVQGQVFYSKAVLRIGMNNSHLDNAHSGGIIVGLTSDGRLFEKAIKWDNKYKISYFDKHPNTNIPFKGKQVHNFSKIIDAGVILHENTPHLRIISWDFMINSKGDPVLIEGNYRGQSVRVIQFVHKEPVFGDNTSRLLKELKVIKNK